MNKNILLVIILIVLVVAAGFWWFASNGANPNPFAGTPSQTATTPPDTSSGSDNAAGGTQLMVPTLAARAALAGRLSIPEDNVVVTKEEETTWNDGCLGLAKPDELCTEALVDGYRIEMTAGGKTYVYRTDRAGTNVRAETK
jgi:hypothetical protein